MKNGLSRSSSAAIVATVAGVAGIAFMGVSLYAQRENIAGIRNFTKVDGAIACGGATDPAAVAELAKRGYKTLISLRESGESGAQTAEVDQAARAAGMRFIHIGMSSQSPNDGAAGAALGAIRDAGNQPVFLYDASGSRAAAILMIKRMLVDGWPEDRAYNEAVSVGLSSPALKAFALDYVARHK
jgi:uncharacterized protein (TIGR01244 family)